MKRGKKTISSLKIGADIRKLLSMALKEDVGSGDVTSRATIPKGQLGKGLIFSKGEGVLCGVEVAREVMRLADPAVRFRAVARDGAALEKGSEIALLKGPVRSILTAERVMLNFLQRLSGTATLTGRYVESLRKAGSGMEVVDTRKTTPLWRTLERHAVRCGGGANHRFALYDMYLVKNNHVDAAGGVKEAVQRVWRHNRDRNLPVAVEARNIGEVRAIVEAGENGGRHVDLILLDNMSAGQLRRSVQAVAGRAKTEITGGVTLKRVKNLAGIGVDRVSVGALTHSAPALDISLHVDYIDKKTN